MVTDLKNRTGAVASGGLLPQRKPTKGHERGSVTNAAKRRDVRLSANTVPVSYTHLTLPTNREV